MKADLPKHVADSIDRFTGRVWLLPAFLKWWDDDTERLLLLIGDPGTGKSMIMAWLAGHGPAPAQPTARTQLSRLRSAVKAAHFCQAASRNITPQALAESIANQLTDNAKGFADALTATLAERVQINVTQTTGTVAAGGSVTGVSIGRIDLGTLGDELSFDRAFTQPLKKLYANGYRDPMLLLVDALDEAQTYTGQVTLPELLSRLIDLPPQVRILATTRDEPRVLKFFRDAKRFDLIKDADPDVDDVRTYAEGRLAQLATIDAIKCSDFARRLSTQAGGVFLYAALVLDDLLARPPSVLPDLATYPLPDSLSGLYHDFLTRELGKIETRWFDLYEPLLGLIAVTQGDGLTTRQLTDLVGQDVRAALRASKQYLAGELPAGPFRPFHKSFADFLLNDPDNTDFHIDAATMHKRIAGHYLSKNREGWAHAETYALAHLPTHLGSVQAWTPLEELLLAPAYVRALSDFSNDALADAYRWAEACVKRMPLGPRRELLLQLSHVAPQLRGFVSRAAAMREIDSFLESDDTQHLLIVGRPGTGKSALVAQSWVRHLDQCVLARLQPGDSLRATFAKTVLHTLSMLQDRRLETDSESRTGVSVSDIGVRESFETYERLFHLVESYGKRVCIIIDELDAIAGNVDTELRNFPIILPPNLQIMWVSRVMPGLRYLARYAWALDLDELNRPEFLELCRQRLGGRIRKDLVERIAVQCDGTPLFIELIARQLEDGMLSERELEMTLSQDLAGLYEAKTRDLETRYPEMRERLTLLVRAIATQDPTTGVGLEVAAIKFDLEELASMQASGLFAVKHEREKTIVGVVHASMLDFLCQRYALR